MNKLVTLGLVAALAAGCSLKTREIPSANIPFASADYTVLGSTSAEACGTYIFGLNFGGSGTYANLPSPAAEALPIALPGMGGTPEARTALYEALGRMPEATHLLAPRVYHEASGILLGSHPLFGQRCATIEARGVQIGTRPVPNAE